MLKKFVTNSFKTQNQTTLPVYMGLRLTDLTNLRCLLLLLLLRVQPVHQVSTVNCKITSRQLRARHAAPSNQTPTPLPNFFSTHRLKRSNVTNSFGEFLFHYSCNAKKQYVFILMPYKIGHAIDNHLKNAYKLTHKRRKSAKNTNEDSNAIAAKPVVEAYLHSTSETSVDTNQTAFGLFHHLPRPATATSDAGESSHISNKSCLKPARKNTKPATDVTTRPAQRCLSPSGLQISSDSDVYNRSQQPHCHATEGTPDTNTYLPPNVPTSDDSQSSHINNKRKPAANVTTCRVQQCLSTSGSQSTSANGLCNRSEQQDCHATKGTPDSNSSFLTNAQKKRPTSRIAADTGSSVHNSGQQSNPHQSEDPEVMQGLIEFLDTHNELVQVFRTARDKCSENDVPEFKVRLYNGNGARGYELPTSQAIGAIVFDSGPTTETDYDIIIEYRDGPTKRQQTSSIVHVAAISTHLHLWAARISYKVNVTIGGSR
ncbi:hypothetical protein CTI12_AA527150 [Artemisia annua]|uniref:Helitron helicase-like domain-containing protein n=1 Tax=Artemisia annua TaxID=35608 RepID=A0A2U1L5R6_ARTAN|nr:hypothetical protein CTI12_AA527150 [Artemisia annua]